MRTRTSERRWRKPCVAGFAGLVLFAGVAAAKADGAPADANDMRPLPAAVRRQLAEQAEQLRVVRRDIAKQERLIEQQEQRIEKLQHMLTAQEDQYLALRKTMAADALARQRAGAEAAGGPPVTQPMPQPGGTTLTLRGGAASQRAGGHPPGTIGPPPAAPISKNPGDPPPRENFGRGPPYHLAFPPPTGGALS